VELDAPKKPPVWWTDDRRQQLRDLWSTHSNSQIATIIGAKSRCAVSGMANRMGLKKPKSAPKPKKPRNSKNLTEEERAVRRRPKTMAEIIKGDSISPLLDSIHGLTPENCAYPYGDREFKFCGRKRVHGSYCMLHGLLCYQQPRERTFGRRRPILFTQPVR
jgi:hypothetical protein